MTRPLQRLFGFERQQPSPRKSTRPKSELFSSSFTHLHKLTTWNSHAPPSPAETPSLPLEISHPSPRASALSIPSTTSASPQTAAQSLPLSSFASASTAKASPPIEFHPNTHSQFH